ncbi:tRNA (adenosine(37)-N6)-dimethylallyltransferase MiaA [Patescibacteria group bacterium]|nr:tRNA (adenosine(37)-N6)-dimethylallyltransferase MiaA [Patescibacteria group bacterium]
MAKPKLIVIVGPTASGKTDLAIKIAKQFDGEVISADSRMVYRGMDIGTAKPEGKRGESYMINGVPHWGIDILEPDEDFTAANFKKYADQTIKEIIERGHVPILAGGTGLYVSAVVDNLTFTEVPPNEDLRQKLEALTNDELLARISEKDPKTAETIDAANRRRLIRALEIIETTGEPLAKQQRKGKSKYEVLEIAIDLPREELYERIDQRVDRLIATGLVDEVRGLKEQYGCEINAMTGIGYRQICAFLQGFIKLKDAIELLKRDTRHYAKRQMTWFRRDDRIKGISSDNQALELVKNFLR